MEKKKKRKRNTDIIQIVLGKTGGDEHKAQKDLLTKKALGEPDYQKSLVSAWRGSLRLALSFSTHRNESN